MKITTTAEALIAALKDCRPMKKTTIPVLSTVLVEDNRLIATDLDITTIVPFEAKGKGRFLLPYRAVLDVLAGEKGKLTIEAVTPKPATKGKAAILPSVTLTINDCEFKLDSMNVVNFPQIPDLADPTLTMGGKQFSTLLSRTMFAISQEESRYTLNAALLKTSRDHITMVATDGHRLAYAQTPGDDGNSLPDGTLIPYAALDYLKSRIGHSISIGVKDDHITFQTGGITLITHKKMGKFPNYEAVIPAKQSVHTQVESCTKLASILARVAKCADDRSHAVKFTFGDKLTIAAQSTERGSAKGVYDAVADGTVTIGLSSTYILEFLKCAGDVPVEIGLDAADKPVLFKMDGWQYVVMPMRL